MDQIKINTGNLTLKAGPGSQLKKEEDLKQISAKLHPEYDQDLIHQIKRIPKRERSKIYRDALRKYLLDQRE
jgi:acyl-coenzyme A synthetase/AMP-(fatty) acid ligase